MTPTPRTDALMPCQNHPAMDLARELEIQVENEAARWQDRIDPILARYVPGLDGSGVDSGDPLDLTEWELEKALATLAEQRDALQSRLSDLEPDPDGPGPASANARAAQARADSGMYSNLCGQLRAQLQQCEKDTHRLTAVGVGEWDILVNHHCGGFTVMHRQKPLGSGDTIRQAIDDAVASLKTAK